MFFTNQDVSKAQVTRYRGKWLLCLKVGNESKWLARDFQTATAAKKYFKNFYAPLGTDINEKHSAKTSTYWLNATPKKR